MNSMVVYSENSVFYNSVCHCAITVGHCVHSLALLYLALMRTWMIEITTGVFAGSCSALTFLPIDSYSPGE